MENNIAIRDSKIYRNKKQSVREMNAIQRGPPAIEIDPYLYFKL